jgi:hypothetical protein
MGFNFMALINRTTQWEEVWVMFWETLKKIYPEPLEALRDLFPLQPEFDHLDSDSLDDIPLELYEAIQAWQLRYNLKGQSAYTQACHLLFLWKLNSEMADKLEVKFSRDDGLLMPSLGMLAVHPGVGNLPITLATNSKERKTVMDACDLLNKQYNVNLDPDEEYIPARVDNFLERDMEWFVRHIAGEKQADIEKALQEVTGKTIGESKVNKGINRVKDLLRLEFDSPVGAPKKAEKILAKKSA